MKRLKLSSPRPTPSQSAPSRAPAATPTPASLQALPQELIDLVTDMVMRNHVPYQEVAAVSSAFRQAALSHAKQTLKATPEHLAKGVPCLSQQNWLQSSQAHRWLRAMGAEIDALDNRLEHLGPEALRKSLEPWVAAQPFREGAEEAASKIVEAYRSGASALSLADFGLETLPDALGQLTALKQLEVSDDYLITLPNRIGQLTDSIKQLHENGLKIFSFVRTG